MVEAEPEAPTMMIEGHGEDERDRREAGQNQIEARVDDGQAKDVEDENHELRRDHVRHDRADEEAIFTFEEGIAGRALVFDVEGTLND
jgi:hypothetical protein